jgi:hypothetical protein
MANRFLVSLPPTLHPTAAYSEGAKPPKASVMDLPIMQQTCEDIAQQLRQWALSRNVSLAQTEQMATAVLSGQYDAQMLQAISPIQTAAPTPHQHHAFATALPTFSFQTSFSTFPLPPMPPPLIPPAPTMYPQPATVVPSMFPTTGTMQPAPYHPQFQSTRTTFPGGESVLQSSPYAGQQGNRTLQYSSSSASTIFTPVPQQPTYLVPMASIPYAQKPQSALPAVSYASPPVSYASPAVSYAAPALAYVAMQAQPRTQHHFEPHTHPRPQPAQHPPVQQPIVQPEPGLIFNPSATDQAPQNRRLAETFKQQLMEATYFSDIPGMRDRSVRR